MSKPKYDTTVARIAGNILSGLNIIKAGSTLDEAAAIGVQLARAIVAEVKRTEPQDQTNTSYGTFTMQPSEPAPEEPTTQAD